MPWTTPETFTAGQTLTAASMNLINENLNAIGGAWTSYTPAWTSAGTQPAVGNGTATGRYIIAGKFAVVEAGIRFGSTSTFGSGAYFISVPTTAQMRDNAANNGRVVGMAFADDAGAAMYPGWASREDGTKVFMSATNAAGTYGVFNSFTPTVPFTMANGDGIFIRLMYEVA